MLFLDQKESLVSKKLEELLNKESIKQKLESEIPLFDICDAHRAPFAYECAIRSDIEEVATTTTAIRHEVFEEKRNRIKNCRTSFSELQRQFENQERSIKR